MKGFIVAATLLIASNELREDIRRKRKAIDSEMLRILFLAQNENTQWYTKVKEWEKLSFWQKVVTPIPKD